MTDKPKHPKIKNPHDSLFKDLMDHPKVYREFFLEYLPAELVERLDLETVKPSPKHFVTERFKHLHSDCLFEAQIDGKPLYVYVLVEHQSTVDPLMPFRLWQYMVAIWEAWLKEREYKSGFLPLIYPMVIYSGRQTCKKVKSIRDLIKGPREVVDKILFQPFPLVDLSGVEDERLAGRLHVGLLFMALKHAFDEIMPLDRILVQLPKLETEEDVSYFLRRLVRYILELRDDVAPEHLRRKVEHAVSQNAGEEVMSVAERLREEGRIEGWEKGLEQGIEKGLEQGKLDTAKRVALYLLKMGVDENIILQSTGLSLAEFEIIKRRLD